MTDTVSRCLSQLHRLVSVQSPHRGVDAANLVVDLSSFCLQSVAEAELAYCSSLLFNKEHGVISFLHKIISDNEFTDSKAELLKFLNSYIEKLGKRVNPYAVEIKDICVKVFSLEHTSKVKVETFPLLIQLLEMKLEPSVVEKLNIPKLIDKYFNACVQSTKQQSTVRNGIYHILGIFAEVFPEHMISHSDRLVSIYVNILKAEMVTRKSKKPDMQVIAGCLKGLTSYMVNFTQSVEEGSRYAKDIYDFARMAVDTKVALSRYEVPRAGLYLFAKHAGQLREYMTTDHEVIYDCFYRWCCHHNRDTKYAGLAAMDAFLKQVSEYIVSGPEERIDPKAVFKAFIKKFRILIDSNTSNTHQISIAIKGYGYLSKPCKIFMKDADIKFMFTEMMQRSEQIYLSPSESLIEDKIEQLPHFLDALSCIIEELDEITDGFLVSLERLIIVLFENFPRLSKGPRVLCYRAVVKVLFNLSSKGAVLKYFLSQVVYHGLIRTCSHPVVIEEGTEEDKDRGENLQGQAAVRVSYKDYLELWEHLLDKNKFKSLNMLASDMERRESMHEMVYDELIQAILRIIHKLDLTSTKDAHTDSQSDILQQASTSTIELPTDNGGVSSSDPVAGLQPKVQKDFLVFINLVDFCKSVLPAHCVGSFERWIYVFGRDIIVCSTRFPVVSGFYKLLEVCMKICKSLEFFKNIKMEKETTAEDMDMEIVDSSDCMNCFVLFRKFVKEVLVKMKQFKDDLLSSCLELVLSLPNEMISLDVAAIVPALKLTFKLGLGYLPLAQAGLTALEQWDTALPADVLRPYFKDILPCLDAYLKSSAESSAEDSAREPDKTITMSSKTSSSRGRKISLKLLRSTKTKEESDESPLAKIRFHILRLLGMLGGETNLFLLGSDIAIDPSKAVAWDTENHLSFAVPFQDMKPTIYFDPFLPRVVELATTSSDRQTKVAACELLHSLVLYMLGKGVTQAGVTSKSPMENLWKRIIPALLQLACDVERVSAQLFRPLVSQLIHWFTNNRKYESPETIALLDALLDGVIHPTDTSLRDFSSQCIREFLQWSIKQTSEKQLSKSPINIKSLLKRLYSLALHPSASKRMGAALAFNNIYTVFREESSLVDIFVLEILITYLDSLALTHADDQAQGTQDQCSQVICHVERIIKAKAGLLNKENKHRRIPRGFQSVGSIILSHLIPWLIKHCGKPQAECRHQCMKLVCQISPLLPKINSAAVWMKNTHEEHGTFFIHRFEGGGGGKNGIFSNPTLDEIDGPFSLKETLVWFDFLLAALDCYTWAFGERLLSPKDLFGAPPPDAKYSSVLFKSLCFFLSKLAMFGIQAAKQCFPDAGAKKDVPTPKEIDDYNRAKCTVIVRIMNFLTVLLQLYPQECFKVVPTDFWMEDLYTIILSCMLEPGLVGFNVGDVEVIEKLPEQTSAVCHALSQKLPSNHVEQFNDCLARKLALGSRCNLFEKLPIPLSGCEETQLDHLYLSHLVNGYRQLHAAGLLMTALRKQGSLSSEECGSQLLNAVYEGVRPAASRNCSVVILSPASQQLASKLLELAFELGLKHEILQRCIIQPTNAVGNSSFSAAFYTAFQSIINGFFIKDAVHQISKLIAQSASQPNQVCSMLNAILDYVYREKTLRKRYGTSVAESVVNSWGTLCSLWTSSCSVDLKHSLLQVLKKILILDSKCLVDPSKPAFQGAFKMYLSVLTDKSLSLAFKSAGLELLPYFTKLPEKQLTELKSCLDSLVADNFPLKSTEFIPGSPKYNDYISALDKSYSLGFRSMYMDNAETIKLLVALVSSGSLLLLKLLITIMCREETHTHEEHIQTSLVAFIKRLQASPAQAKAAVDVCFQIFTSERDHRDETRRAVVERMCIPLLCNASKPALVEFFTSHIKSILAIIEAKQVKPHDAIFETQLISKLCCYELIEVLYSRLNKTELNSPESLINKAYCLHVKTGKELTMAITKCAHAAKSEDMRGESVAMELRRQVHCAAYNALLALVSCTQIEQKFYVGFLFSENPVKGQFLLDNLVDLGRKYEFEVELSAPMARKKQMTSIRLEARSHGEDGSESGSTGRYMTGRSVRYLSSQYLADSSLSEEVSQFDFSTPVQAFAVTDVTDAPPKPSSEEMGEDSYEVSEDSVEMDELNQHECMDRLCALLKHLKKNKISPQPEKGVSPKEMPAWMSSLHRKFSSHETHINVQHFIAKLITNQSEIFEPYAKFWISPLMEVVLKLIDDEGPEKRGLNYFVVDLLVTMLSWSATAIPEDSYGDRHLASRLLETVMRRTHHESRSVFRNNLEIVKTMVEVWKDRIQVPTKVIYEAFSNPDPNKKDNATGIQLLGIVLANRLSPFSRDTSIDRDRFYSILAENLTFKYKDVHAAAAEVCGIAMKHMAEEDKVTDGSFHELVASKLICLTTAAKQETGKFITCVHRLQINYPLIVDRFMNRIMFMLPTVHGTFKTQCLEIILSRVGHIPNLFLELKTNDLTTMFSYRDEGTQVALLKIIQGLLEKLSMRDLEYVTPSLTAMVSNPSTACRDLMYDIFIWIYDTYRSDETFRAEEGAEGILTTAKDYLLRGLVDDNKQLRLKLQNFWSDETRLPNTTLERLVDVLRAMYSPSTESQYLSYTTNLILHLTSFSPDFDRLMFEQPLSECKFEEYSIDYSWQQRHLVMTPLFAATQGSTLTQSQGGSQSLEGGIVRSTQTMEFTPTQDQGRSQAVDWLNPSSQGESQASIQSFSVGASETQSSLLFTTKARALERKLKPVPHDFGSQRLGSSQGRTQEAAQETSEQREILRLKRRFLKNQSSSSGGYFVKLDAKKKKLREQAKLRQKAARESQVVMYRKYRAGDLPDIQIKYSELIAPLQALAQCDSTIAKHLFSALFRAILAQIGEKLNEREAVSTVSEIQGALDNMMSSSTQYFPPFISSIQDICFHEAKLTMQPATVSTASLTSLQQPTGIMLLEKQLLQNVKEEPKSRKRARVESTPPSETTATWLELAKLYRSLGEYDVLQGIFSEHIGTQKITRQALEAEARGDHAQALKLYNEAIDCNDWQNGEPQQEEEDMWDDARLECFANLTQWENLEKFSAVNIDDNDPPDLDKIWSDTFYQEHYLPFLLRSQLKLRCKGVYNASFVEFVKQAMTNKERKALLESRHSDDLALLHILLEDYDRARYYVVNCLQGFLMDWSGLDSMMVGSRSSKLQSLQKITEMQEFLDFIASEDNFTGTGPVDRLFTKWSLRFPNSKLHPISVWDDIVTNRCVFMNKLFSKFETAAASGTRSDSMDVEEATSLNLTKLKDKILREEVLLQLRIVETAKDQANFPVAKKYLREALRTISDDLHKDDHLQLKWTHAYAAVHHKKAQGLTAVDAVETALTTVGQLEKHVNLKVLESDPIMALRHHILRSQSFDIMTDAIATEDNLVLSALDDTKIQRLASICGSSNISSQEKIVSQLMTRSFTSLQAAIKAAKSAEDRSEDASSSMVQAMMAMVKFCDGALRKKEEDAENAPEIDVKLFPGIVVRYLLKAMTYNSEEARQRFPRLLQLVEIYPDTLNAFAKKAEDVPCWMFIGWINQMVALMDKREGRAVHGILQDLATYYPQALCYAFKISSEQFVFDNSRESKANQEAVRRVQAMLDIPLVDDFITALEQLHNPEMAFKDWCDGHIKVILESKDKAAMKDCYLKMYKQLFDYQAQRGSASQIPATELGPHRKRFAKEHATQVQKVFGKDGEKLNEISNKKFQELCKSLKEKMDPKKSKPPGNLKEYSPWLSNFQSSNYAQTLEVPGQYTGQSKPLREYHVHIAGFDEKVLVLTSMRRPKRIIIRGDDEKDYMFLVKGGEDLRLDQRIEQLFCMMNDVMAEDPACSQRKLRLKTYQVIPMTPRVGLIEWMKNTKPLKDFLLGAMSEAERRQIDLPAIMQNKWLMTFGCNPITAMVKSYGLMYSKASRTETESAFNQRKASVPWNLLRRAFEQMTASPEAYHTIRSHFARTHACVSICQYILGIGDRHLSNFMIDTATGGMVGIDFGHSFGSATQFLSIPELIPFRLTHQIINFLLPLKVSGLLRNTMIHTLRALRVNNELLLNTMDVFVQEPSLDWQAFARSQAAAQGSKIAEEGDAAWYPREKVNTARKKLEGANPAYITRNNLRLGHSKVQWLKGMEAVCMGDSRYNVRTREPESGLSVETQVDCLIDQATDPNILGRTYRGWEPWM